MFIPGQHIHCKKITASILSVAFFVTTLISPAQAQVLNLPQPGTLVGPTPAYVPVLLKGMTIHPDNPLQFDFIIDSGDSAVDVEELRAESERLVKYFLASMTTPENDLWVNLSPYESDRIIPEELAKTELGRDLLAQDYLLKQLTSTLMHPDKELGKAFWQRIYQRAQEEFGTTDIPVDTFNKVWILPDKASVYEHGQTVYVVDAHLKVMLDVDYAALENNSHVKSEKVKGEELNISHFTNDSSQATHSESISAQIVRDIILPEIEQEVNTGKNFAPLRQIYYSLILAKWYKETIQDSLLNQIYVDQNKVGGVDDVDTEVKNEIYEQYIAAYKTGVFNFIKEDYNRLTGEAVPRKYFSGGFKDAAMTIDRDASEIRVARSVKGPTFTASIEIRPQGDAFDQAMNTEAVVYSDFLVQQVQNFIRDTLEEEDFEEINFLREGDYIAQGYSRSIDSYGMARNFETQEMDFNDLDRILLKEIKEQARLIQQSSIIKDKTAAQQTLNQAFEIVQVFMRRRNIPFQDFRSKVRLVPGSLLNEIEEGRTGEYSRLVDIIFVSDEFTVHEAVHEAIHSLSKGIPLQWLDEGITEYLTIQALKEYEEQGGKADLYQTDINRLEEEAPQLMEYAAYGSVTQYKLQKSIEASPYFHSTVLLEYLQGRGFDKHVEDLISVYISGGWSNMFTEEGVFKDSRQALEYLEKIESIWLDVNGYQSYEGKSLKEKNTKTINAMKAFIQQATQEFLNKYQGLVDRTDLALGFSRNADSAMLTRRKLLQTTGILGLGLVAHVSGQEREVLRPAGMTDEEYRELRGWLSTGDYDQMIRSPEVVQKGISMVVANLSELNFQRRFAAAKVLERVGWEPANNTEELLFLVSRGRFAEASQKFGSEATPYLIQMVQAPWGRYYLGYSINDEMKRYELTYGNVFFQELIPHADDDLVMALLERLRNSTEIDGETQVNPLSTRAKISTFLHFYNQNLGNPNPEGIHITTFQSQIWAVSYRHAVEVLVDLWGASEGRFNRLIIDNLRHEGLYDHTVAYLEEMIKGNPAQKETYEYLLQEIRLSALEWAGRNKWKTLGIVGVSLGVLWGLEQAVIARRWSRENRLIRLRFELRSKENTFKRTSEKEAYSVTELYDPEDEGSMRIEGYFLGTRVLDQGERPNPRYNELKREIEELKKKISDLEGSLQRSSLPENKSAERIIQSRSPRYIETLKERIQNKLDQINKTEKARYEEFKSDADIDLDWQYPEAVLTDTLLLSVIEMEEQYGGFDIEYEVDYFYQTNTSFMHRDTDSSQPAKIEYLIAKPKLLRAIAPKDGDSSDQAMMRSSEWQAQQHMDKLNDANMEIRKQAIRALADNTSELATSINVLVKKLKESVPSDSILFTQEDKIAELLPTVLVWDNEGSDFRIQEKGDGSNDLVMVRAPRIEDADKAMTDVGGIDLNAIDVEREGSVDIRFSQEGFEDLLRAPIDGFAPVIINITPLPSIMPLLGLDPALRDDEFEVSSLN